VHTRLCYFGITHYRQFNLNKLTGRSSSQRLGGKGQQNFNTWVVRQTIAGKSQPQSTKFVVGANKDVGWQVRLGGAALSVRVRWIASWSLGTCCWPLTPLYFIDWWPSVERIPFVGPGACLAGLLHCRHQLRLAPPPLGGWPLYCRHWIGLSLALVPMKGRICFASCSLLSGCRDKPVPLSSSRGAGKASLDPEVRPRPRCVLRLRVLQDYNLALVGEAPWFS